MWKQVVVVAFEEAYFPGISLEGLTKRTESLNQDYESSGYDFNTGLSNTKEED
jgi:hypothetical protein